jgi:hypothetical protein
MKDSETKSHKRDSNKKRNDKLGAQQFWLLEFLDFFGDFGKFIAFN